MDDLKKFSAQIIGGLQGGNTNAGTGDAAVNAFAKSAFVNTLADKGNGLGALASQVGQEERAAAEASRQAAMQKIKDKMDPNKYRAEKDREDGGFSFYDPDGNQIGIDRFSAVTGQDPSQILKSSDNPFDLQYVNDYGNTRDLVTAIQNGDTDKINEYRANNKDIGSKKPEDLMRELIQKYPHIYGNGQYKDSYRNNNNPLLRHNAGMLPTSGGSAGGSSGNTRNWNS